MFLRRLFVFLLLLSLSACGGASQTSAPATSASATSASATSAPATSAPAQPSAASGGGPRTSVIIAMPYIPNIQFAPYYIAKARGYYAAAGIDVTFDYQYETDSVQRVAQGNAQFGLAGGDSVLLARAQGLPIVTVATNSQRSPTVFFSKAALNIKTPADLKGKSVGIPGRFGASYIGLLALLYANQMTENDLNIQEVGFAQVQALSEDKIQVASGYGNNEPVQLAQQGIPVNVIKVSDSYDLVSDGLLTNEALIVQQPDLVRGFVQATLHGMQDVIDDPDAAFTLSLEEIPELKSADEATRQLQRQVLQETLPYWQSDGTARNGLGYTDEASWLATHTFLRASGLLTKDVDIKAAVTNAFIPR
jgi:NitT/TauT family transport system substrate-binding protein